MKSHFDHERDVQKLHEVYWRKGANEPPEPLAAGSGIIRTAAGLWVVADDLHHLVFFDLTKAEGTGFRIFDDDLPLDEKARKKVKPDLEALIEVAGDANQREIVAFPSGSKPNRARGSIIRLGTSGELGSHEAVDFSPLIEKLGSRVSDLNIEGGAILGHQLVLLQRGNGKSRMNGLMIMDAATFKASLYGRAKMNDLGPRFLACMLGEWQGVPLTFTDCFAHESRIYYSAAAEAGDSTYFDGEVVGSSLEYIDEQLRAVELARIPGLKIEGIAISRKLDDALEIFAVTDADDPSQPSQLMRIKVPLAPPT